MPADTDDRDEDHLVRRIQAQAEGRPFVVAIGGLSGSGKTTLARRLTQRFAPRAVHVSEDDFCVASTDLRKSYLQDALRNHDLARLRELAAPLRREDNPYANPLSWYDWAALSACLRALKRDESVERKDCWNQTTGANDRVVRYAPLQTVPALVFIDSNYPLQYRDQVDFLVVLDLAPQQASERQRQRDAHRSDPSYLAYKEIVDELYCRPYFASVRAQADWVLRL